MVTSVGVTTFRAIAIAAPVHNEQQKSSTTFRNLGPTKLAVLSTADVVAAEFGDEALGTHPPPGVAQQRRDTNAVRRSIELASECYSGVWFGARQQADAARP
jgi:hypothetical protein